MYSSRQFSVATAGAIVLGGVAAVVLATVIAFGERGGRRNAASAPLEATAPKAPASTARTVPSAEGEYLLDVSDATDASGLIR